MLALLVLCVPMYNTKYHFRSSSLNYRYECKRPVKVSYMILYDILYYSNYSIYRYYYTTVYYSISIMCVVR